MKSLQACLQGPVYFQLAESLVLGKEPWRRKNRNHVLKNAFPLRSCRLSLKVNSKTGQVLEARTGNLGGWSPAAKTHSHSNFRGCKCARIKNVKAIPSFEGSAESIQNQQDTVVKRWLLLAGALLVDGGLLMAGAYENGISIHDLTASLCCVGGAFLWVRLFDELARRNVFEQKLSRKIVHITTGLIYFSSWTLFSASPGARFYAALAPVTNIFRMLGLGYGLYRDDATVKSICRHGDPRELLRGPLYYALVLASVTISFWRNSPIAGISVTLLCGGDGIADIVGRRFGSRKLPWNPKKSWAGSLAMFLFGTVLAVGATYLYCSFGYFSCDMWSTTAKVALISMAATIVESLPISSELDDNLTVPVSAMLMGTILFS